MSLGVCPQCKVDFSKWVHKHIHRYQQHINTIHNVECSFCPLKFINERSYDIHFKQAHTRKYLCRYCDRGWWQKSYRDRHEEGNHKFKCDKCEKRFVRKRGLDEHRVMFIYIYI